MKGVVLYYINNHEVFVSRNAIHHEYIFPYSSENSSTWEYHIHTDPRHIQSLSAPHTEHNLIDTLNLT